MKKLSLLIFATLLILLAAPVHAQFVSDACSVSAANLAVTAETPRATLTYTFSCAATDKDIGQVTRYITKLSTTGLNNLEVEDDLGTLTVLEGPAYAIATEKEGTTTLGVIFRKGLLLTDTDTTYTLKTSFDAPTLVSSSESGARQMKPGLLVKAPKVTIVTTGITEATLALPAGTDVSITLPEGSSIEQISPAACSIQSGVVQCNNLNQEQLDALEVRWISGPTGHGLAGRVEQLARRYLPSVTDVFTNVVQKGLSILQK